MSQFQREEMVTQIKKNIEEKSGDVKKEFDWGLKQLAYPIEKNKEGYYHIIYFESDSNKIDLLTRDMHAMNEDGLLRFMFIKADSVPENLEFPTLSET